MYADGGKVCNKKKLFVLKALLVGSAIKRSFARLSSIVTFILYSIALKGLSLSTQVRYTQEHGSELPKTK